MNLNKECDKLELTIFKPSHEDFIPIPLFSTAVSAGFPSPAESHIERSLDLNQLLIQHPAATFFVRVEGHSMREAGIQSGDVLIVDRALSPQSGRIIVAILNGEFTLKRILIKEDRLFLVPENPQFRPIEVSPEMDFEVWGVVTYVIHKAL
jgi:DNA polymerase V